MITAILLSAVCSLQSATLPERRILWVDATANIEWTIHPAKVADFCKKAGAAGFNELVVDVKPINGQLLISAPLGLRFRRFKDIEVDPDYDLLKVFLNEGHKNGLRIDAGLNVFSEGHSYFPGVGLAYTQPGWQSSFAVPKYTAVLNNGEEMPFLWGGRGRVTRPGALILAMVSLIRVPGLEGAGAGAHPSEWDRIRDIGIARLDAEMEMVPQTVAFPEQVAVFVDPLALGVRERMLEIIKAVAQYEVDGIVFDRLRYPDLLSGFGPAMRKEFEKRCGPIGSWPESVFTPSPDPRKLVERGPRFADWMQFRAELVTEFLRDARQAIHEVNPKIKIGAYVGAGWETYYEVGVNYSSDSAQKAYDWATPEYGLAGYAGFLDFLMPGCFYKVAKEVDPAVAPGRQRFTVEGAAKLVQSLSGQSTAVVPALYGLDWEKNHDGLREAIRQSRRIGRGVMIFDASYVLKNDWWSLFKEEFRLPSLTLVRK